MNKKIINKYFVVNKDNFLTGLIGKGKQKTRLTIPKSVKEIGSYVFWNYKSLKNIFIPNSVIKIGNGTFTGCEKLKNITIPKSVKEIGNNAFKDCKKLEKITFAEESQLEKIGDSAFENCTNLTNIIIPNSVTKIGYSVFYNCINLQTINIPESVTEIGGYVFMNCKKLTSDSVINNSPVLFGWWVWNHQYNGQTMSQMDEIDLSQFTNSTGKNFNVISPHTFSECRKLNKIIIPKSVTTIGNWAFIENTKNKK